VLEGKNPRGREDMDMDMDMDMQNNTNNNTNPPPPPLPPPPQQRTTARATARTRTRTMSPKSVLYHYYEKAPRHVKLNSKQWITWEHHHGNRYGNGHGHGAKEPPNNGHRDRNRGAQQNQTTNRSFTSIFVCPMSGEAFLAGPQYAFGRQIILSNQQQPHHQQRVGNPGWLHGSETKQLHWYSSRFMAENAAAARAWDCFLWREGGNLNDFRLGGGYGGDSYGCGDGGGCGGDSYGCGDGGPPPYPRGKRPAWPPSQQFPFWVQMLVRCTRERSGGKPKPATHHSWQEAELSSRERAVVAAAAATPTATATATAGNSPDITRKEFGSSSSLTTRSSTNRNTRGVNNNKECDEERMLLPIEVSAFPSIADHEATVNATTTTTHTKATDSTGKPKGTESIGDDIDDREGTSRVGGGGAGGVAVAVAVPRKSCGNNNPNKNNSTSGEPDKNVSEGPSTRKESSTASSESICNKPRASLTGIASSASSTAIDDHPKHNSPETMGLPIVANEKIGNERPPKHFETPSGSVIEEKASTLSTTGDTRGEDPRLESFLKDGHGPNEGNKTSPRQRISSDRPHKNMVQNRTPELGDESNDNVVDGKEGDSPLVSLDESTTELESESKKRKHERDDSDDDDDDDDDSDDDVPLILLKEKKARRNDHDRAVPRQKETGNSRNLRDASSNGKNTRSEAVHSTSNTPSPNQFSRKVGMAEKEFDADDADDANESMGNSVIDLISIPSPVSDEREEYASNVKKNEEKIDSFLQAVYGFSADYAQSKKQHSVNDADSDVDVVECIEIDIDGPSETVHKPNDRSIDLTVAGNKRTTKPTTSKAKAKPRFKPHKRTRKNEKEATATRERQKILSPETNESWDNTSRSKQFGSSANNSRRDSNSNNNSNSNEFHTNYGGRFNKNPQSKLHTTKQYSSLHENRFIFHPSNNRMKPEDNYKNKFLGMDIEDALKEQERLFQRSAARVRTQATFRVTSAVSNEVKNSPYSRTFPSLVRDVHLEFTDHWKYRDCYARLGLPRHASEQLIKSQYRRLARVYHPDRNLGKPDTKHKFQAVTEAYNSLINNNTN